MSLIDTIFYLVLGGFVFYGLFYGLIRTLGAFFGLLAAALAAGSFYAPVAGWLEPLFFGYGNIGKAAVFLLLFSLVNRLVVFLFYLLDRTFNLIAIIPFLKSINRLLGAVLGFLSGAFLIGLAAYFLLKLQAIGLVSGDLLADSEIGAFALKVAAFFMPFFPEALERIREVV